MQRGPARKFASLPATRYLNTGKITLSQQSYKSNWSKGSLILCVQAKQPKLLQREGTLWNTAASLVSAA